MKEIKEKKLTKGYIDYINSNKWKLKRKEAFNFHGKYCKRCGSKRRLNVHHMTYERFTNELIQDLCVLCHKCHELFHKINSRTSPSIVDRFIAFKKPVFFREKIDRKWKKATPEIIKHDRIDPYKNNSKTF